MSKTLEILRQLRAAGLTQSEIGRRSGVSQSRLSRWERGRIPAGADDALRLRDLAVALAPEPQPPAAAPLVGEGANA